jgi:hypothetical protein
MLGCCPYPRDMGTGQIRRDPTLANGRAQSNRVAQPRPPGPGRAEGLCASMCRGRRSPCRGPHRISSTRRVVTSPPTSNRRK